jgi:hypothetical protein
VAEPLGNIGERLDLQVRRGSSFVLAVQMVDGDGRPIDLTGAVAAAAVKKKPSDTEALVWWAVAYEPGGWVNFLLGPDRSILLPAPDGFEKPLRVVWDARVTWSDGYVEPLYYGYIEVFPGVAL